MGNIKKFEQLEAVGDHLEQLWASYNSISTLNGLDKCTKLKVLYVGNNKINSWQEIEKLKDLPELEELVLYGNPIHASTIKDGDLEWPLQVLQRLPNLKKLDGISVIEWKVKISEGNEHKLKDLFNAIDKDGSGDISIQEMKTAFQDDDIRREMGVSSSRAEDVFSQMDEDDSGSIMWEEFKEYFSTKRDLGGLL